ncbi:MAG: hypothetical protein IPJ19_17745 [Planctomycetes bacterium]|nr:hypothetical protein [Planctomycetota bacterium]
MSAGEPSFARAPVASPPCQGLALGVALMLQPWWPGGMRVGFFVTLASVAAQIVFSHMPEKRA